MRLFLFTMSCQTFKYKKYLIQTGWHWVESMDDSHKPVQQPTLDGTIISSCDFSAHLAKVHSGFSDNDFLAPIYGDVEAEGEIVAIEESQICGKLDTTAAIHGNFLEYQYFQNTKHEEQFSGLTTQSVFAFNDVNGFGVLAWQVDLNLN